MEKVKKYGGHLSKPNDWKRIPENILKMGMKVEWEHSDVPKEQRRITADHWVELGDAYYPELLKMERKIKKMMMKKKINNKII
jgi:hypothetical protein